MEAGTLVAGRFVVESLAGEGGMSRVYRARDARSGDTVALKVLRDNGALDPERFVREAQLLAELSHPAIVRYVAHGDHDGRTWLAMEWLTGEDLYDRLQREGLTVRESVALARRVCEGLAVAHARGIVHRDIKPPNVFLPDGDLERAKIVDFGIALRRRGTHAATRTGAVLGTPGYMAPEQVRGERVIDGRADLFSVGCMLFECLTGHNAFEADTPVAILARILLEDAPRVSSLRPDVPAELDELVAWMTARAREDRVPDAASVLDALDDLEALDHLEAPDRPGIVQRLTDSERRLVCVVAAGGARPVEPVAPGDLAATYERTLVSAPPPPALPALLHVARAFGGRCDVLDHALLVVFSEDGDARDLARRAARCALALAQEASPMPVALVTGRAELLTGATVGEAVDRAFALLDRELPVEARSVRVDDITAALVQGAFAVETIHGAHVLTWDASDAEAPAEPERLVHRELLGRRVACVGRERELAVLDAVFEESVAGSAASAVVITGEAGIGKTRVVGEFLQRLRSRYDETTLEVWYARGDAVGAGASFALLTAMLRRAAGVVDGHCAPVAKRRIRERFAAPLESLERLGASEDTLAWITALAGVPVDAEDSPSVAAARDDAHWMGEAFLRAWDDLLDAETRRRPLVLVVDDLQWGDPVSVRFLEHALRARAERPLVVVAAGRDEIVDRFPRLWESVGVQAIRLGALNRRAAERFVRAALGPEAPGDVVARIVEHAGGSALFLEELARVAATGARELPPSVVAITQARIAAMEPGARRVLRVASVFGQTFWRGGLGALLGGLESASDGPSALVDEWIEELARREVLERRESSRFPGEVEWSMRSPQLAAAAYATLTDRDRVVGHGLAGEWLARAGEGNPLVLCDHFERAGAPRRAAGWRLQAAREALEGHDHQGALAQVEAGLARCAEARAQHADEELDLVEGRLHIVEADARLWRGEPQRAVGAGAEAMRLLVTGTAEWFRAAGEYATALGRTGNLRELFAWIDAVAEVEVAADALGQWAVACARVAVHLFNAHHTVRGDQVLHAVERGVGTRDLGPVVEARLAGARASRAAVEANVPVVERESLRALRAYERAGDLRNVTTQTIVLGIACERSGRLEEAERWLTRGDELGRRLRLPMARGMALRPLGHVHFLQGDTTRGIDEVRDAIAMLATTDHRRLSAIAHCELAWMYFELRDDEAAAREAATARALADNAPVATQFALSLEARIAARAGRHAEARALASGARALTDSDRAIFDGEAMADLAWAEALVAQGDTRGAREALDEALAKVRARSEGFDTREAREAFLRNVPAHASLAALRARVGD